MTNIMVFIPASPIYPHIQPLTMRSINKLKWNEPFDIVVKRDDMDRIPETIQARIENTASKHIFARELFLRGNYEAMLTIDSDIIIPSNALERLNNVEADIVFGLYVNRPSSRHCWMLRFGDELGSKIYTPEFMHSVWNKIVPSDGLGNGCTLIRRKVLEAIEVKYAELSANDCYFAKDAKAAGFRLMTDCSVICGHIINNNEIAWPDPDKTYRITKIKR